VKTLRQSVDALEKASSVEARVRRQLGQFQGVSAALNASVAGRGDRGGAGRLLADRGSLATLGLGWSEV